MPRKPYRAIETADRIKKMVLTGEFEPGQQLPIRSELSDRLGVSLMTTQRAVELLKSEGYLTARGRSGTFVSDCPPNMNRIAVLVQHPRSMLSQRTDLIYFHSIIHEIMRREEQDPGRFVLYYDIQNLERSKDYCRLMDDIDEHNIAGVLFTEPPIYARRAPLLNNPGVPATALAGSPYHANPAIRLCSFDYASFYERALVYLTENGCRNISVISHFELTRQHIVRNAFKKTRAKLHERWFQVQHIVNKESIRNILRLLFWPGQQEIPDALIVDNDHFANVLIEALQELGLRIPDELRVVCHWNFSQPPAMKAGIQWVGFDVADAVEACLISLKQQIRKEGTGDILLQAISLEEWLDREAGKAVEKTG